LWTFDCLDHGLSGRLNAPLSGVAKKMEEISAASRRLSYPGADKVFGALRGRFKLREVRDVVAAQPQRQLFRVPRRVRRRSAPARVGREGRVAALDLDDRWMADLADLTAQPDGEFRYVLVVLNCFDKTVRARALTSKTAPAVAEAFRVFLAEGPKPSRVDTDAGAEFRGVSGLLSAAGIWHSVKDPRDSNPLAPVDRAIATLKQSLFRRVSADGGGWARWLPEVVRGYNETVHSSLQGRAPDDVRDDAELQFALRREASEAMARNAELIQARDARLERSGAFRIALPPRTFQRSYKPRFGSEVHRVSRAQHGFVVDARGQAYASRHAFAVPAGTVNPQRRIVVVGAEAPSAAPAPSAAEAPAPAPRRRIVIK
jgi:hypothetical protein